MFDSMKSHIAVISFSSGRCVYGLVSFSDYTNMWSIHPTDPAGGGVFLDPVLYSSRIVDVVRPISYEESLEKARIK